LKICPTTVRRIFNLYDKQYKILCKFMAAAVVPQHWSAEKFLVSGYRFIMPLENIKKRRKMLRLCH
jgi:hypothetical protein